MKKQNYDRNLNPRENIVQKDPQEILNISDTFIEEPSKKVPVLAKCKILVLGGG
jgi:hypothetical protein